MEPERQSTTCKTCNRVIWVEDADKDGNCPDHVVAERGKGPIKSPDEGAAGQ